MRRYLFTLFAFFTGSQVTAGACPPEQHKRDRKK